MALDEACDAYSHVLQWDSWLSNQNHKVIVVSSRSGGDSAKIG